ncbi:MAG TPA: molecular chaperone TorD family protein [Casimicrobiaceae bacterium]|nr:molecular chaperone TorD family protein [Casimicrobiaceae bacterium]
MSEEASPLAVRLEPEDQARASFYALLARLFGGAPDPELLRAIAEAAPLAPAEPAGEGDRLACDLALAWDALRAASARTDAEALREEYRALFVGVGRSDVSPYASHYLGRHSGRPLAEIRAALGDLGLARRSTVSEFEDHIAVVFEAMRMLVAGDGERLPSEIADQRKFFERYLVSWVADCCAAIDHSSVANYWRHVAQFARCFVGVETAAFALG